MQGIAIIPSRYSAQRLPGKPLADIAGKPMIQWVYEAAKKAKTLSRVIVATDDKRIEEAVKRFGGEVMMTDPALPSGTDRVAAVAEKAPADFYVNVQGDEPLMSPEAIDACAGLIRSGKFTFSTVMTPMKVLSDLSNMAVVKVLADQTGRAIYFSRYPIPYSRQAEPQKGEPFACHKHVGLYGYTKETLFRFRDLPVSALERGESLEQLRALNAGIPIGITEVDFESIGVDTPEELNRVREILGQR